MDGCLYGWFMDVCLRRVRECVLGGTLYMTAVCHHSSMLGGRSVQGIKVTTALSRPPLLPQQRTRLL
jgi:hypothetical protein